MAQKLVEELGELCDSKRARKRLCRKAGKVGKRSVVNENAEKGVHLRLDVKILRFLENGKVQEKIAREKAENGPQS